MEVGIDCSIPHCQDYIRSQIRLESPFCRLNDHVIRERVVTKRLPQLMRSSNSSALLRHLINLPTNALTFDAQDVRRRP